MHPVGGADLFHDPLTERYSVKPPVLEERTFAAGKYATPGWERAWERKILFSCCGKPRRDR